MQEKNYKVGIIIPDFCDQRYLRDRDENIIADSEEKAIEIFTEKKIRNFFNDDEIRMVKSGQIKIGIIE